MDVAIAYPAFFSCFKQFFPELELFKKGNKYDLVIFSGGEDINPSIYGQRNEYSFFNPDRDQKELAILDYLRRYQKETKILGVCRGHQLIHAIFGGNLVQDISEEMGSSHHGNHGLSYPRENFIKKLYENKTVNSLHHQGVIGAGEGLFTLATHEGVIEASKNNNIVTTQFHPELMGDARFFNEIIKWVNNELEVKSPTPDKKVEELEEYLKSKQWSNSTSSTVTSNNITFEAVPNPSIVRPRITTRRRTPTNR